MIASVRHELIRRPSTSTVQAPHCPWSQPFLVPVRSRRSRSASSKVVHGATMRFCSAPLTNNDTGNFSGAATVCHTFSVVVVGVIFISADLAGTPSIMRGSRGDSLFAQSYPFCAKKRKSVCRRKKGLDAALLYCANLTNSLAGLVDQGS